jgi:hypothetical protein
MKNKGLALGLTLSMLVCTSSFSVETKDEAAPQPVARTKPADPIAELRNQDSAFALLMEAFRQIQGRIIQNDYQARLQAANALSDLKTRRYVFQLAKEEQALRVSKLYHQISDLNLTYDQTRRDDERALAVADVPMHIDTRHAAKSLMDFVFIAPAAPDKNGEIKATAVPAKNSLLDKLPDPVE